ncbi:ABC transporter permease [Ruminiclostridium cellobioparum]|uniref:ABC-type uncharacterized transport system, permease component n=1 Tax=Ruminiclostridium cellobioparum subsp. termitidis CT1112 TaxID=1195236 RepID=S0FGK4_RUMCE|nr:ABC-2 family transporter protein [Ruminiclostridium cellobioparum]EMS70625.1 ABC-type uncharacterized transport system, permease component [Ruminiclostridium cellobioparum subsp. termitidis CT1112]
MAELGRLYGNFIKIYLKSKLEYRFGFILEILANFVLIGVYFSGIWILFDNFNNIAGWSKYEFLFLFTTNWLTYSISSFLLWQPMKDMGELVRSGGMDSYLIRPLNPLVYLVVRQFQYTFLPRLILAAIFWWYSLKRIQVIWSPLYISYLIINMFAALLIFSGIYIFSGAVSFWTVQSSELTALLTSNDYGLRTYSDYPLNIFHKGIQILLTFIFPYAFTGYYEVVYLLGMSPGGIWQNILQWCAPLAGVLTFGISICVWNKGVQRYGSSGT